MAKKHTGKKPAARAAKKSAKKGGAGTAKPINKPRFVKNKGNINL